MNVTITPKDGIVIAETTGKGNHFVLGELLLCTEAVLVYDWFGAAKSSTYYTGVSGACSNCLLLTTNCFPCPD